MTMLKKMGSFRSYVTLEEYEMKQTTKPEIEKIQPDCINGEVVIAEAVNVLKFTSLFKRKGISGSLFVTNARVIFVSSDNQRTEDAVPLLSVNTLWYYENSKGPAGSKKHRRVLKFADNPNIIPSSSIRVHEILVACSSFKVFRFSFKFSPMDHGLRICNAIIHHAFPIQLERLFYFDYSKVTSANWRQTLCNSTINIPSYLNKSDWLKEMNMLKCLGYRISNANENFQLCGSLPEAILVPSDLIDPTLHSLAEKSKGGRPPHCSWADSKGAGILRMSKLNNENDSSAENSFFEVLRKTHPQKKPPEIFDLDLELPTREIRQAFHKLFELCCPESFRQFEETDSRFLSLLEQTKWMFLISKSLEVSNLAASLIVSNRLVILQEQESRDTACLCSSLIQVVVDSRFRTVNGFFSLIQKEWIAFGHPFHSVYMHASPIFLLFLDCVYQLMKQNIVEFEFNDKFLARIWESCFDGTRGTFLFDTPQQRRSMDRWNEYTAWGIILSHDLSEDKDEDFETTIQISKEMIQPNNKLLPRSLMNPMYKLKSLLYPPRIVGNLLQTTILRSSSSMCDIHFWTNLYQNRIIPILPSAVLLSGSEVVSKPILTTSSTMLPVDQNNVTPSTGGSSNTSETTFVYPSTSTRPKFYSTGRDPMKELKLVDLLLAALSSSTRYLRHSPASSAGISRTALKDKVGNYSPTGGGQNSLDARRRRNPFSHL